jgi:hypothetical protein
LVRGGELGVVEGYRRVRRAVRWSREHAERVAMGVAMLNKFTLVFKTKTIEFFAEEEKDEDAIYGSL